MIGNGGWKGGAGGGAEDILYILIKDFHDLENSSDDLHERTKLTHRQLCLCKDHIQGMATFGRHEYKQSCSRSAWASHLLSTMETCHIHFCVCTKVHT